MDTQAKNDTVRCISLADKPRLGQTVYTISDKNCVEKCVINSVYPLSRTMTLLLVESKKGRLVISSRPDHWRAQVSFDRVFLNKEDADRKVFLLKLKESK